MYLVVSQGPQSGNIMVYLMGDSVGASLLPILRLVQYPGMEVTIPLGLPVHGGPPGGKAAWLHLSAPSEGMGPPGSNCTHIHASGHRMEPLGVCEGHTSLTSIPVPGEHSIKNELKHHDRSRDGLWKKETTVF